MFPRDINDHVLERIGQLREKAATGANRNDTGEYSISDLAELFAISRPTVYRTLGRNVGGTVMQPT